MNRVLFAVWLIFTFGCGGNEVEKTILLESPKALEATNRTVNSFVANWSETSNAEGYILTVAHDPEFTQLLYGGEEIQTQSSFYTIQNITKDNYYYKVRALRGEYETTYSNVIEVNKLDIINLTADLRVNIETNTSTSLQIIEGDDPNNALWNTQAFNEIMNFYFYSQSTIDKSSLALYLPAGVYWFNQILIGDIGESKINGIQFYGDGIQNTVINLKHETGKSGSVRVSNVQNFSLHDFSIDGTECIHQGGFWVREESSDGIIEKIEVKNAAHLSFVLEGNPNVTGSSNNITVRDCIVRNQREWKVDESKAMFLAGGGATHISFDNCRTYSESSKADHFDTDNATYVNYMSCVADGTGSIGGVGFWNEAEIDEENDRHHEAISTYTNCKAINTYGGLGISQNSKVNASNFIFDDASKNGWAVRQHGYPEYSSLILDGALFKNCGSISDDGRMKGGIHVEAKTIVSNCRFIDTPENSFNISIYKKNDVTSISEQESYLNEYLIVENCEFDKGVIFLGGLNNSNDAISIGQLSISNSIFNDDAKLQVGVFSEFLNMNISENTFFNLGLHFFRVNDVIVDNNRFISKSNYNEQALIFDAGSGETSGIIRNNSFHDYDDVVRIDNYEGYRVEFTANEYINCIEQPSGYIVELTDSNPVDIPETRASGSYLIIASVVDDSGVSNDGARGVYAVTEDSNVSGGSVEILDQSPFTSTASFLKVDYPSGGSKVQISSSDIFPIKVALTVIQ